MERQSISMKGSPPLNDLKNVRVLLLEGFARQAMPMMLALHKLGCQVTTYNTSRFDVGYASRYPDRKIIAFWDRNNMQKSLEALRLVLSNNKYDVVLPLTDFSAILLSKNKAELSKYASLAVNDWDITQMVIDKQNTMMVCIENGIPCPYTLIGVDTIDDILNAEIGYPFVIKPRTSYGAIGFQRIEDEEQLRKTFNNSIAQHGRMLVQEYIPQTDMQFQAQLFIDRQGEMKSACIFNKTRWYPINGGSFCCGATVKRPDIAANCIKLLNAIGWTGYADIDLIKDPRDGAVKILEVNPRITGSVKICFAAGVDFARQIVENETGREVTEYTDYIIDCQLRYMHTDILWFLQSPERFKAKPSWFSFKNTTDEIFSRDDPWPWVTYSLQSIMKMIPELRKRKRL